MKKNGSILCVHVYTGHRQARVQQGSKRGLTNEGTAFALYGQQNPTKTKPSQPYD